ncbi:MAG TPA: YkgJ family cysteine cluster protein [Gammaproteobacteria bacterium]
MSTEETVELNDETGISGPADTDQAFEIPFKNPVKPVQYTLDDRIQFNCHKGIACFNKCCKSIEIQLTPYDILRLKKHFDLTSKEFVARYTMPFEMDAHSMPGLRLVHKPGTTECVFLTEEGCSVYADRPTVCRYYALGNMGVRKKDGDKVEDVYFLVKEDHCLGHYEPKTQTVRDYLHEQGADQYDEFNKDWRDIIIKKRSSGPTIGKPSERSMQLFDMCSYDIDNFREFIQSPSFQSIFDLDEDTTRTLIEKDGELLKFAMRFLKQVLYGETSIPIKTGAREQRLQERHDVLQARKQAEIEKHKNKAAFDDYIAD